MPYHLLIEYIELPFAHIWGLLVHTIAYTFGLSMNHISMPSLLLLFFVSESYHHLYIL